MKRLLPLCVALALAVPALGQQTGDAMRNYSINGQGAGGTSVVGLSVLAPGTFNQTYATQSPNTPVIWLSGTVTIGSFVTPNNSVDLNLFLPLLILGNGLDPSNFINNLFNTNGAGNFTLNGTIGGGLVGQTIPLMMAHLSGAVPEGFLVSQVLAPTFLQDGNLAPCVFGANPAGTPLALTDDSSTGFTFGFPFNYYGVAYTSCFVGSNGFITFNTGSSSLGESIASHLSSQPSIRMFWDDLNPGVGGTVTAFTDNVSSFEVAFTNVPEFSLGGSNSFLTNVDAGNGIISMCFGAMSAIDGLTGVSPGGNLDPVGTPLNLSLANNNIPAGGAAFELFNTASPNDLAGNAVIWVLDGPGTGNPILQL